MVLWHVLRRVIKCKLDETGYAVERATGTLTETESYDWIAFLLMANCSGAYNRYFERMT